VSEAVGRVRQAAIYLAGLAGRRPAVPVAPERLEADALAHMRPEAAGYVAAGAGMGRTMAANRAAFDRWRIVPRMARGAGTRDLGVTLLGRAYATPFVLAPIGVLDLARADGDVLAARAAARLGVPVLFSNQASAPMERCAAAMDAVAPGAPRWFQLYPNTDDAVNASMLRRAAACGCEAVVLTLDTTLLGWRPLDLDAAFLPFLRGMGIAQYVHDPAFMARLGDDVDAPAPRPPLTAATLASAVSLVRRHPGRLRDKLASGAPRRAVRRFLATFPRPALDWDDVAALRALTPLPFLVKGVLHADDARRALDAGCDGVIVSNHGGRQVDGAVGALDALPAVVAAVGDRAPVLFDSGVRGGADAFKALALGAAWSASGGRTCTASPSPASAAWARCSRTCARSST
jgi:lactate 2-monooxygenase